MMGTLQKYFTYGVELLCGIPSVTLLGEKADWEDMLKRLDKLPELGKETAAFARVLRPVLRYFVASFEPRPDPKVMEFWGRIAHQEFQGSGATYLSGWITAFCFWDTEGKRFYGAGEPNSSGGSDLDGVSYHRVETDKIPTGFASVPLKVNDNGVEHRTQMVAGLLGMELTSSGKLVEGGNAHVRPPSPVSVFDHDSRNLQNGPEYTKREYIPGEATEHPGLDTIQPISGWLMYELVDENDMEFDEEWE
jgi:hypothetical protein